jgi:hypothetical protein
VHGSCVGSVCGVYERSGPARSYAIEGSLGEGDPVAIVCQTEGEKVTGAFGGSSIIWDRLTDGHYVSDLFVDTPAIGTYTTMPAIPHPPDVSC